MCFGVFGAELTIRNAYEAHSLMTVDGALELSSQLTTAAYSGDNLRMVVELLARLIRSTGIIDRLIQLAAFDIACCGSKFPINACESISIHLER